MVHIAYVATLICCCGCCCSSVSARSKDSNSPQLLQWRLCMVSYSGIDTSKRRTQSVYAKPVEGRVQSQNHGAGDHLGTHNLLGLKVVVGCDGGSICPDSWQHPPDHHVCL